MVTRRTLSTEAMNRMEDGGRSASAPEFPQDIDAKTKPRIRRYGSAAALKATMTAFSPYCKCSAGPPHLHENVDRLVKFEEVPKELQFNKHVINGYRQPLTYTGCLRSFFCCHNETMNIVTHFAGLMVFMFEIMRHTFPKAPTLFYVTVSSLAACMFNSVMYHTFMNYTPHYNNWLTFDVCGIYLAFLFAQPSVIWFGFTCFPHLRVPFLVFYYSIGLVSAFKAMRTSSIELRAKYMCFTGLARGTVMIVRFVLGAGRVSTLAVYLVADVAGLLGAMVNSSQLPERWYPGKFDYVFNSHQIMHLLAFIALYGVYIAICEDYLDYHDPVCLNGVASERQMEYAL